MDRLAGIAASALRALGSALAERAWRVVPLFAALALIRLEHARDLGLTLDETGAHSIGTGLANDFIIVSALEVVSVLGRRWQAIAWIPLALFVGLAAIANTLYFKFFGLRLDLWVIQSHLQDMTHNAGSVSSLGDAGLVYGAISLIVGGCVAAVWVGRAAAKRSREFILRRLFFAGASVMVLLVVGQVVKGVVRNREYVAVKSNALASQVLVDWVKESRETLNPQIVTEGPVLRKAVGLAAIDVRAHELDSAAAVLAAYRDTGRAPAPVSEPSWPLVGELNSDAQQTARLRELFGLPTERTPHAVVFFLESVRGYEFFHPELGPLVFPNLHRVLGEHGIVFTQAYSSSAEPGQTTRGKFSTTCSMLPNFGAPAPSIGFPDVRVTCLPELLTAQRYATAWVSAYHAGYHNTLAFEEANGTQEFFDVEYFRKQGVTQNIGQWGMADGPYLKEAAALLGRLIEKGRPVYSSVLNLSTHHPHSVIPEGPVPEALTSLVRDHGAYAGYLSWLVYLDKTAARFIEDVFAGPGGDDVLLVLLADHSIGVASPQELTPVQSSEVKFRIPMAFLSKNLQAPAKRAHPVHQIDVPPMIASVLGIQGEHTWLGRPAFDAPGSPFVFGTQRGLHYRVDDRVCHTVQAGQAPECWRVGPGEDPMLSPDLEQLPEQAGQSKFFRDVVLATRQVIVRDLIAPPVAVGAAQ